MAAAYGKDGKVDWEKFHEIVKDYDVTLFDPPQKKVTMVAGLSMLSSGMYSRLHLVPRAQHSAQEDQRA